MNDKEDKPFILEQLEEALEERQTPDRRRENQGPEGSQEDRRKGDRRDRQKSASR